MLITLDQFKTLAGVTEGDSDDFLTTQLQIVSETIRSYCRRNFNSASYIQTFYWEDYKGQILKDFSLYEYPLVSVASVVIDTTTTVPTTDYRIHLPTGKLIFKDCASSSLNYFNDLKVTYTAGYASVPLPVQDAITSIVSERYSKKKAGINLGFGSDVQQVSIPGVVNISYDYTLASNERSSTFGSILGNYINILDYYRSERAIVGSGELAFMG